MSETIDDLCFRCNFGVEGMFLRTEPAESHGYYAIIPGVTRVKFNDAHGEPVQFDVSDAQRLALATALLPGAAIVADPAGLWALIEELELGIPWCGPDCNDHRRKIRAALGISEGATT